MTKHYGMFTDDGNAAVDKVVDVARQDVARKAAVVQAIRDAAVAVFSAGNTEAGDTAVREAVYGSIEAVYTAAGMQVPLTYSEFWDLWFTAGQQGRAARAEA